MESRPWLVQRLSRRSLRDATLIPYGCAKFRISMFPITERAWKASQTPARRAAELDERLPDEALGGDATIDVGIAHCGRAGDCGFPSERFSKSAAQMARIASSSPSPSGTAGLDVLA